jgi:hypothetical protein
MPPIFQENVAYVADGTSAPIDIQNIYALAGIQLDITGLLTVAVAQPAVLTSAGILAVLRQIEFDVGGTNHHRIGLEDLIPGGQLLEALDRAWYGSLPFVTQPGVNIAANAFNASLVIPFKGSKLLQKNMEPEERLAMCFRRNGRKCQMRFQFGSQLSVAAPAGGGTAVTTANIRVSMIEERTLDNVAAVDADGKDPLNHYHRLVTESIPIAATVQPAEQQRLNLNRGISPGMLLYALDNDVASETLINTAQLFMNGNDQRYNASWDAMKDQSRSLAGSTIAYPNGFALMWFDDELDGMGMLPLGAAEVGSTIIQTDHDVSAGGNIRFAALHMYQA